MVSFKYWLNGEYTTITLKEDESKHFRTGGSNDEGYSVTDYEFTLEDGKVTLEVVNSAKDCDGRMDSHRSLECSLDKLEGYVCEDGTKTPDWTVVGEGQRDYEAEKAGY